ncbi:tyrosine-protein kinase PR2-like isoform X2 [Limulus polyphemus]|uniref:non-specific protein-tyrosine kinase n=1 Tax=Limulus polyphemus TaxID=6850 RepID=A0ABM1SVM8_LIMPO|nr:tyrosine-protein kinase PR2-like isoform X2 [Limulus polyphemus]
MNSRTGSSIHGLYELLVETELVHYYSAIKNELKVTSVNKLRYVQDEELANIGFSKLEQRRLHRYFQKHLPPTYINKIKSKILSKSKEECDRTSTNLSGLNINKISSPISLSTDRVIAIDNIEIIKDIGVGMFGVVKQGIWYNEHDVKVTELAPQMGLLECLREPVFQQRLPVNTLCDFSLQICDAMKYLESRNLIHQNLGAHNVLIFGKNKVKH